MFELIGNLISIAYHLTILLLEYTFIKPFTDFKRETQNKVYLGRKDRKGI